MNCVPGNPRSDPSLLRPRPWKEAGGGSPGTQREPIWEEAREIECVWGEPMGEVMKEGTERAGEEGWEG